MVSKFLKKGKKSQMEEVNASRLSKNTAQLENEGKDRLGLATQGSAGSVAQTMILIPDMTRPVPGANSGNSNGLGWKGP